MEEMLRYAVAVATANAMSPNTGDFDPGNLANLLDQAAVKRIS